VAGLYYIRNNNSYKEFCNIAEVQQTDTAAKIILWEDGHQCYGPILKLFIDQELPSTPIINCYDSTTAYVLEIYLPTWKLYQCIDGTGAVTRAKQSMGSNLSCPTETE
jgi:hypothetical protein